MPHDLIIYDCDGTLIDTETIYAEINLRAYHALGLTHWTLESYVDAMVGIPVSEGRKIIEAEYGRPLPDDFDAKIEAEAVAMMLTALNTLPGAPEAVASVEGARCVASSTSLGPLRRNLTTAGLIELFDPHIFSASQVARGKPHPDVFLFASETMGVRPSAASSSRTQFPASWRPARPGCRSSASPASRMTRRGSRRGFAMPALAWLSTTCRNGLRPCAPYGARRPDRPSPGSMAPA